ncbi:putative ribonuclease H-like domain-containing protein [Tanacetum coccineum]|uniref:Ribonuclease H-like domain-containing protein n=1 Tax=Tanacetum coccineum TaxID=301880 RepID=A0ABQ4XE44_9ASTR
MQVLRIMLMQYLLNNISLLPLLYDSPQSSTDVVADDAGKKTNEEPTNEGERNGQEKGGASNKENDQNVQDFRAEFTVNPSVCTIGQNFTNADDLPTDPLIHDLEDTGIFSGAYDDKDMGAEADLNNLETTMNVSPIPTTIIHKDHPKDQIIGDINSTTQTRRMTKIFEEHAMVIQSLTDPSWIKAMQEELLQFKLQKVWTLVDLLKGKRAIGTKWVYRNKKDERGFVVRNKSRLVAQGYTQEEGIDYDKVFAPVARIEAIMLFLAYASFMGFIMYQMDVKSAFLYGTIEDEMLSTYLLKNGYRRGTIDKTLFIKKDRDDAQEIPDEFYGGAHFLLRIASQIAGGWNLPFAKTKFMRLLYIKEIYLLTKAFDVSRFNFLIASIGDYLISEALFEDETAYKEWEDRMERAATIASSLEAEQDNETRFGKYFWQAHLSMEKWKSLLIDGKVRLLLSILIRRHLKLEDSDGISTLHTLEIFKQLALMGVDTPWFQTMLIQGQTLQGEGSTIPVECSTTAHHDSPLLRVHSLGSDEGMKKLEHKVKSSKARRRVRLVVSEDEESVEDPSKQGTKIAQIDEDEGITLVQMKDYTAEPDISTANVPVSTVGAKVSTASLKQRIARVHEEASTFNAEEWDNIQAQIEADEELAHRLQAQERERYSEADKARLLVVPY